MGPAVWYSSELSNQIIKDDEILKEIHNVVTDIVSSKIEMTVLVENMAAVLTNQDIEHRARGVKFLTSVLKELPKDYLSEMQLKFISKFYADRLKDNHRVVPHVLEGYLYIVTMNKYNMNDCKEFLTAMFMEVPCQSQVRQDRHNIYQIIENLFNKDSSILKTMGPDFIYGFISTIEGERDPRNLLFIFKLLPKFMSNIPLGHLSENMFEVLSCYFPIDFHPSPDDPDAVTRDDLSNALLPCLSAVPEFAEECLVLIMEKLDSNLRVAKTDSLKLLAQSCNTFAGEAYFPFSKAIWSSIWRELCNKTDDELRMTALEALYALTKKLASNNTDQKFEKFIQLVVSNMQTSMAESTNITDFNRATKVLLTVANASKESCEMIVSAMIPSTISFYSLISPSKIKMAAMTFLAELSALAYHWKIDKSDLINEIPQLCLDAVSNPEKEYQLIAFETLKRILNHNIKIEFVEPFIEVLVKNIQFSEDDDLFKKSVETINALAGKYPQLIMDSFVANWEVNLKEDSKQRHLTVLCNLASIDAFTKIIIDKLINLIKIENSYEVVKHLNIALLNSKLYSQEKVAEIEKNFHVIDSLVTWIEGNSDTHELIKDGLSIISNITSSLTEDEQRDLLTKYYNKNTELLTTISVCISLKENIYEDYFQDLIKLCLDCVFDTNKDLVRRYSCILLAHFFNKLPDEKISMAEVILKQKLENGTMKTVLLLCGYLTKALLFRGSNRFEDKLAYITEALKNPELCFDAADSIRLIMDDSKKFLTPKFHCKTSILYKQRIFQKFTLLTENYQCAATKEAYLLSWAYILREVPKTVLVNEAERISSIAIDSLEHNNIDLLTIMTGVLIVLVKMKHIAIGQSVQTILPRLINLSKYQKSMDVRIKSLECLFELGHNYPTLLLLPFKQDLLYDLIPCLDDKKRQVRAAAVRARTRWFLVGAPGEAN